MKTGKLVKTLSLILAIAIIALLPACYAYQKEPDFQSRLSPNWRDGYGANQWPPRAAIYSQRFVWKMRYLARGLVGGKGSGRAVRKGQKILMSTLVPVDNLYMPTSFGRLCMEQLITELEGLGYIVVEARKSNGYEIKDKEGEFFLTRDLKKIGGEYNIDSALMGTYALAGSSVLVNVRLVDLSDSSVAAAASAHMDLTGDLFLQEIFSKDMKKEDKSNRSYASRNMGTVNVRQKALETEDPYTDTLDLLIHRMAGSVDESMPDGIPKPPTVAVMTFVDVDNLYRSVTFGRYVSDKMIGELHRLGYNVKEIRVSPDIFTDIRIGELGMTRELNQIINNTHADALLVGTYTRAEDKVFVNGRLILAGEGKVVGAGEMVVDAGPQNKFITAMLENEITTIMPQETIEGY